jgi:hypothetical protein
MFLYAIYVRSANELNIRNHAGVRINAGLRNRRDLDWQPVAPSIFLISNRGDFAPKSAIGLTVEHARRRLDLPLSDPDHHFGIASDVLDPSGGFACFGEQVETIAADYEPNLDLAMQPCRSPDGGQV